MNAIPLSATQTAASGPNHLDRGLRARIRASVRRSDSRPIPFLTRLIGEQKDFEDRTRQAAAIEGQISGLTEQLQQAADREHWSRRKLAEKVGLPRTTLRRIEHRLLSPEACLTHLRAAAARLAATDH